MQSCKPNPSNNTAIQYSDPLTMALYFPDELIHEVLLRLPAKSLLKFKCVSKPWFSLISSTQFIRAHLNFNISIANQRLLIVGYDTNTIGGGGGRYFKHYSLKTLLDGGLEEFVKTINITLLIEYISCCKGLVLTVFNDTFMYLWNPCIRKVKKLPDLGLSLSSDCYSTAYGFGYDEVSNDYKVVVVIDIWPDMESWPKVMVYSTKTESWRRIGDFPGFMPVMYGVFVDGKLYWKKSIKSGCRTIVFLDLATETYGGVEEPSIDDLNRTLGTFGGNLSLCCTYGNADTEIWVMKEDGVKKSWIKVLSIPHKEYWFSALSKSPNGEVLALIKHRIGLYNPKDCSVRYVKGCADNFILNASCFIESLINPMSLMSDGAQ